MADPVPSLSASVWRGAIWVVANNMLLRLANVAITAVVAHILSPRDFGVYTVALTVYAIVSSLSELGVSSCLIRADLDIDSLAPTVATISVLSNTTMAGVTVVLARPFATALGSAGAANPIRVMSLALLFAGVFAVPMSQMVRDFKQDKIFLANAIGFVPSTALLVIMARTGSGAMAFAWAMVAKQFIFGCVLLASVPRRYRFGHARCAVSVVLRFGIPLAGANVVNYLLLNADYAFVGHFLGVTALGVYMLAFTVASWPYGVLGGVLNSVSMPAFSRVKHDPALLKDAMATAVRAISLVVMPMCALTMVLARPLVLTLYGDKWAASAKVLVVLSLYGVFFILCLLFANMLTGLGQTRALFVLQIIWISTLIPAMALGVNRDGIVGAAYAHVAVIVPIVFPSYLLALKRATHVRFSALGKAAVPAILASSAAAFAARGTASHLSTPLAQLVAGLASGCAVYLICVGRQAAAVFGGGRAARRVLHIYKTVIRVVWQFSDRRSRLPTDLGEKGAAQALAKSGPMPRRALADDNRRHGDDLPESRSSTPNEKISQQDVR